MLPGVTTTAPVIVLRPPLWLRCWAVVFPFAAVAFVVLVIRPGDDVTAWVALCVVTAVGSALAIAQARQRVDAFPDGRLVVRNRLGTRSFTRDDIADVAAGPSGGNPLSNWRVELVLTDGSPHPLTVTERPPLPGVRRRVERDATRLREWLTGRPAPFV